MGVRRMRRLALLQPFKAAFAPPAFNPFGKHTACVRERLSSVERIAQALAEKLPEVFKPVDFFQSRSTDHLADKASADAVARELLLPGQLPLGPRTRI